MIANKKISEVELNRLANNNNENFIETVKHYADKGREQERQFTEKLDQVLRKFEDVVKTKLPIQDSVGTNEEKYKKEIIALQKTNRLIIIVVCFAIISLIWWTFNYFVAIPKFDSLKNYSFIKIDGQAILITLTLAIFNEKYKPAWITGTVTLTAALLALLKL